MTVQSMQTRSMSAPPPYKLGTGTPFTLRTSFKAFNSIAEVLVGPKQTRFLIHKELLSYYSTFFAAALNNSFTGTRNIASPEAVNKTLAAALTKPSFEVPPNVFAEGLSQSVQLPEERVDSFEYFVHWLYTQRLEDIFKDGKPTYFILLELYSLADRLCVEKLRNDTVDKIAELAEKTNSVLTPSDTYILYESIRDSAPPRRLVLDLFAFKKTDNLLATHVDDWHPLFLRELVVKLKRPGFAALTRHALRPWKATTWSMTKACEVCREVMKPQQPANSCKDCLKVFCSACLGRGGALCLDWPCETGCKPWKRSMCYYHEHVETEPC